MNSVELVHLTKAYGKRLLLGDVSLSLPNHGFCAILGDSGSGKSSLLDLLSGLDTAYEGEIRLFGSSLKREEEKARNEFRLRSVGYLRQGCDLLELESALENVILPLKAVSSSSPKSLERKGRLLLEAVSLGKKAQQRVNTLSGGEKQRVALARALACDPKILLCDEPTGALDQENAEMIFSFLHALSKEKAVLLVSHDERLVAEHAERIYRLENAKLTLLKEQHPPRGSLIAFPPSHLDKKEPAVPFSSWLLHARHRFEAKKLRSAFSSLILLFSLIALGLSFYAERDLGRELEGAFASLSGEECVVMEKKRPEAANFSRVIASDEKAVASFVTSYPDLAYDYGVSYRAPFESFFPEENEVSVMPDVNHNYPLAGFSIRSVNDFVWLDLYEGPSYPEAPSFLEDDEVILGLPLSGMEALCFSLHITRSYASLGTYLLHQKLELLISVENRDWTYEDEQLLTIKSFVPYSVPSLLHSNHRWNEIILQSRMRFPSADEEDDSLPWILQKLVYLEPRDSARDFMRKVRRIPELSPYVFEHSSFLYDQSHNLPNQPSEQSRFYVYLTNKDALPLPLIEEIAGREGIASYQLCNEGGYRCYPEALALGFANPFYLSSSFETMESVISLASKARSPKERGNLELPKAVVSGSFLTPLGTGLSFSSHIPSLSSGRLPKGENEIVISSALDRAFNQASTLYAGACAGSDLIGDKIVLDYRQIPLQVVGVVSSTRKVIYADGDWPVDFFRDQVGVSSFLLEPEKAIFHLLEPKWASSFVSALSKAYPAYRFVNPSAKVHASIEEVVGYLHWLLAFASALALGICFFLLLTLGMLNAQEQEKEGTMLFILGLSRTDIASSDGASFFLLAVSSGAFALFILAFLEQFLHGALASSFSSSEAFSWDPIPLLSVIIGASIGFLLVALFVTYWIKKRNFRSEKR
jgi:ABC-type lipoprotein export system ATPase subunit